MEGSTRTPVAEDQQDAASTPMMGRKDVKKRCEEERKKTRQSA